MNDADRLYKSADRLLDWLKNWPDLGSRGKECHIELYLDGLRCRLTLTPISVENPQRVERIKSYLERTKNDPR